MSSDTAAMFEEQRGRLWRVAYRMLGSRAEADDVVQDAYLRWHGTSVAEVRAGPAAPVARGARALCRSVAAGAAGGGAGAGAGGGTASELSMAFLAVLERLAPEERAAFLLHEVFDCDYGDIAKVLGKSEVACRQIVSRARRRVKAEYPRVRVSRDASARLADRFIQAIRTQDRDAMLKLLAQDVTWTSDGGGKAKAARFATGVYRKLIDRVEFRPVIVNGEPGVATLFEGTLFSVMALRTDGVRILDVYAVLEKLKGIAVPR